MKPSYLATLGLFLLSGCQAPQAKHPIPTPQPISIHTEQISPSLQDLALNGVLNQKVHFVPGSIRANSQRLSVTWDGDAIELLAELARQRGLSFAYTGVRLPLPVTIHVQDVTFETLLRIIRTQTDWRAQLDQQSRELRVYFMLPLKQGALA
ncbi:DotD/TraH family lipoprotein [Yersinia enterocolitica]|uniref:DotD/TraH family lipoprotein n=1 Tax=Yersinia enterocolitica TaxID=630 RepID=UPI00398D3DC2